MNSNKQNLINKIKYRAKYRGTKEMDMLINSFVNYIINDLNFNQLKQLNVLINLSDEEITEIYNGKIKKDVNKIICKQLVDFKNKL